MPASGGASVGHCARRGVVTFLGLPAMCDVDLERFRDGYRNDLGRALGELTQGRKRSHWMWFIFPQIGGLGSSPVAGHYAIHSRAEAKAFLQDPTLGPGYEELIEAVWQQVI